MQKIAYFLVGMLLILCLGCGGKSSSDTAAENPKNAKPSQQKQTPKVAKKSTIPTPDLKDSITTPDPKTIKPGKPEDPVVENSPLPTELEPLAFVPVESFALISGRPQVVLNHEIVKSLPKDVFPIEKLLNQASNRGVEISSLQRVSIAYWSGEGHASGKMETKKEEKKEIRENRPDEAGTKDDCHFQPGDFDGEFDPQGGNPLEDFPLDSVAILQFTKPVDLEKLLPARIHKNGEAAPGYEEKTYKGVTYKTRDRDAFYFPAPHLMLVCPVGDMPVVLDQKAKSAAPLVQTALGKGFDHNGFALVQVAPFRELLRQPIKKIDQRFSGAAALPDQLETAFLSLNLNEGLDLTLVLDANTEEAPKFLNRTFILAQLLAGGLIDQMLAPKLSKQYGENLGTKIAGLVKTMIKSAKIHADGKQFELSLHVPKSATELLKEIGNFEKKNFELHGKRNDLQQIGIAAHNFHETRKQFPFPNGAADAPKEELDKLSWRVHLLPYLGHPELYDQFKLNEAWDSSHNKALLEKMPNIYRLSNDAKPGHTQYVSPVGKGFLAEGVGRKAFKDVLDGSSNTIMVLTVKPEKAVPWTKPGGFVFDPEKAKDILGGSPTGFWALLCDGRVRSFGGDLDPKSLKALLTIAGGETIEE